MPVMLIVMIVIIAVVFRRMKAAAEEQQARQERNQQLARTQATTHYEPDAQPAVQTAPSAQMPFHPTEGIPFHPPGFHGDAPETPRVSGSMEKKPLEKADLGAERARQNAHTAKNADWKPIEESDKTANTAATERKPMFTPKQLRDAFIMQEILDEPVSRRKGIKRGYGS